jgi:hypothetical protein
VEIVGGQLALLRLTSLCTLQSHILSAVFEDVSGGRASTCHVALPLSMLATMLDMPCKTGCPACTYLLLQVCSTEVAGIKLRQPLYHAAGQRLLRACRLLRVVSCPCVQERPCRPPKLACVRGTLCSSSTWGGLLGMLFGTGLFVGHRGSLLG